MNNKKLVENNRWKVDTREKKSWDRKKEKKNNKRQTFDAPIKVEMNMNSEELFPSLDNKNEFNNKISNEYLEKIKKQKNKDEELNKIKLKPGWIAYRKEKKSNQIKISRDGIYYYPTLRETYTEYEWKQKEKEEFDKDIELFSYRMNDIYLKCQKESDDYYNETGKLDAFAIVQKEALEYEEYLKEFEKTEEELLTDEESEEDDDFVNSDNDEYFKTR